MIVCGMSTHKSYSLIAAVFLMTPTFALASVVDCAAGTVTSCLAQGTCSFYAGSLSIGPGTLQITGYSDTFGLSPDVTDAGPTFDGGDYRFFQVGTGNASGPLAWNGPGTVSLQMSF